MDNVSRTVRFKKGETEQIDLFLMENPFFDFSSLTRVALVQFIQDPKLPLKGIPRLIDKDKHEPLKGNA